MNFCKKCHKPTVNCDLCNDCKKREESINNTNTKTEKKLSYFNEKDCHNFMVNQSKTFNIEYSHNIIWAPIEYNGQTYPHWSILKDLKVGDKIFHGYKGKIVAISTVINEATIKKFPESLKDPKYQTDGWSVNCEYTLLNNPLDLNLYLKERKIFGSYDNSPFAENGNFHFGYLFPLCDELANLFDNEIHKFNS